ncbi:TPA: type 1 fimbrial protein [Providencia rettgeri]|nr:type 1 fimbrial protein [Providencia rettgeri]
MSFKKIALATAVFATVSGMSLNASAEPSAEVTLQGIITSSTCDVSINGGKSVLNVGVFKSDAFSANEMLGETPLPVSLTNCSAEESGHLVIQGLTSVANNDKNIFVNDDANTVGFMIADEEGKTITNGEKIAADVEPGVAKDFSFTVGMASTTAAPTPGVYSAPVLMAYIVE